MKKKSILNIQIVFDVVFYLLFLFLHIFLYSEYKFMQFIPINKIYLHVFWFSAIFWLVGFLFVRRGFFYVFIFPFVVHAIVFFIRNYGYDFSFIVKLVISYLFMGLWGISLFMYLSGIAYDRVYKT